MDREDEFMEELILSGALEAAGVDMETGELMYNFTDKLKDVSPELHNEFFNYFYTEVMSLWQGGFIEINPLDKNTTVRITEKALDLAETSKLPKDKQLSLKEIVRIITQEK